MYEYKPKPLMIIICGREPKRAKIATARQKNRCATFRTKINMYGAIRR